MRNGAYDFVVTKGTDEHINRVIGDKLQALSTSPSTAGFTDPVTGLTCTFLYYTESETECVMTCDIDFGRYGTDGLTGGAELQALPVVPILVAGFIILGVSWMLWRLQCTIRETAKAVRETPGLLPAVLAPVLAGSLLVPILAVVAGIWILSSGVLSRLIGGK
jgi:hypothetical protein